MASLVAASGGRRFRAHKSGHAVIDQHAGCRHGNGDIKSFHEDRRAAIVVATKPALEHYSQVEVQ